MGVSFAKKEKEKKKAKQKQDKAQKMQERKSQQSKGKSLEDMMAWVDEEGNLVSSPPDPSKRVEIKAEDIQLGIHHMEEEEIKQEGVVTQFLTDKGFGFIKDSRSGESVFVHINQIQVELKQGDKVSYEVEKTPKGFQAVNVEVL